uniref:Uncharacterized protein n=1 Tax=Knipowitschia caucasica TaxID=637954 RepID=A0AAV2KPK2_KNICA
MGSLSHIAPSHPRSLAIPSPRHSSISSNLPTTPFPGLLSTLLPSLRMLRHSLPLKPSPPCRPPRPLLPPPSSSQYVPTHESLLSPFIHSSRQPRLSNHSRSSPILHLPVSSPTRYLYSHAFLLLLRSSHIPLQPSRPQSVSRVPPPPHFPPRSFLTNSHPAGTRARSCPSPSLTPLSSSLALGTTTSPSRLTPPPSQLSSSSSFSHLPPSLVSISVSLAGWVHSLSSLFHSPLLHPLDNLLISPPSVSPRERLGGVALLAPQGLHLPLLSPSSFVPNAPLSPPPLTFSLSLPYSSLVGLTGRHLLSPSSLIPRHSLPHILLPFPRLLFPVSPLISPLLPLYSPPPSIHLYLSLSLPPIPHTPLAPPTPSSLFLSSAHATPSPFPLFLSTYPSLLLFLFHPPDSPLLSLFSSPARPLPLHRSSLFNSPHSNQITLFSPRSPSSSPFNHLLSSIHPPPPSSLPLHYSLSRQASSHLSVNRIHRSPSNIFSPRLAFVLTPHPPLSSSSRQHSSSADLLSSLSSRHPQLTSSSRICRLHILSSRSCLGAGGSALGGFFTPTPSVSFPASSSPSSHHLHSSRSPSIELSLAPPSLTRLPWSTSEHFLCLNRGRPTPASSPPRCLASYLPTLFSYLRGSLSLTPLSSHARSSSPVSSFSPNIPRPSGSSVRSDSSPLRPLLFHIALPSVSNLCPLPSLCLYPSINPQVSTLIPVTSQSIFPPSWPSPRNASPVSVTSLSLTRSHTPFRSHLADTSRLQPSSRRSHLLNRLSSSPCTSLVFLSIRSSATCLIRFLASYFSPLLYRLGIRIRLCSFLPLNSDLFHLSRASVLISLSLLAHLTLSLFSPKSRFPLPLPYPHLSPISHSL